MLRFVLVGCGRIAKRHSELLGLNQIDNAKLVAVCDLVKEKAENISNLMNVPYYLDIHEMMRKEVVDVVIRSSRHIFTTSLTTFGGLLPVLIFSVLYQPLAWAMAAGVLGATFTALLYIPSMYIVKSKIT